MSRHAHVTYSDAELIADMRRVHEELGFINQDAYTDHGCYSRQTAAKRFGSWLKACEAAGLESRSSTGRNPITIEMETRECLSCQTPFPAVKGDMTHRRYDRYKAHLEMWWPCADGWEVVAG